MTETAARPAASRVNGRRRAQPAIALVLDERGTGEPYLSILAADGLHVNGGTTELSRSDELGTPDALVLVADISRPDALVGLRRLRKRLPECAVVVVGRDESQAHAARRCLNAGARAFITHGEAAWQLAPAVRAVLAGLICAPLDTRRLLAKPAFSHREKEILGLLVTGLTNREIAARLYLAESTVKSHLAASFAKLGVRSRKDAAAMLLDPDEGLAATALPPDAAVPRVIAPAPEAAV